jgi:adenosylhomocysteine nucleosidase
MVDAADSPPDVLFVAALEEETVAFPPHAEVVHLGVGKVQAAAALAAALSGRPRPDLVVNVGTAGGLRGQPQATVLAVGRVLQHDLDVDGVSAFVGRPLPGGPLVLDAGPFEVGDATLATGDHLVLDLAARDALGRDAEVVDMEGYAVAAVCSAQGIPVRLLKAVSDGADEGAIDDWHAALSRCSRALVAAARARGWLDGDDAGG